MFGPTLNSLSGWRSGERLTRISDPDDGFPCQSTKSISIGWSRRFVTRLAHSAQPPFVG
jgi:hypothetical protein